jgi:hypothetical protein
MKNILKLLSLCGFLMWQNAAGQTYESVQRQTVSPQVADFKQQVSRDILSPPELKIRNKRAKDKFVFPVYDTPKESVRLFEGQAKVYAPQTMAAPPAPSVGFVGLLDNGTSIPPDVNGAVGPNHVMTTLNTEIKIQNKTGGAVSSLSNTGFWTVDETGEHLRSQKSCMTLITQRFYFVDLDGYFVRWVLTSFLAVSQTSDPTGAWNQYKIKTNNGDPTLWFDFP